MPIYLLHRYQVEAAAKSVGGVDFGYGVKGDRSAVATVVPADRQRQALASLLAAMTPEALDTPERLVALLSSGQSGQRDRQTDHRDLPHRRRLDLRQPGRRRRGGEPWSWMRWSRPERLNRLVDQHRRDANEPGVGEVAGRMLDAAFKPAAGRYAEIARRIQTRTVLELAAAARETATSPGAAAAIGQALADLADKLKAQPGADPADRAHRLRLAALLTDKDELKRVLADPKTKVEVPPGMPIGRPRTKRSRDDANLTAPAAPGASTGWMIRASFQPPWPWPSFSPRLAAAHLRGLRSKARGRARRRRLRHSGRERLVLAHRRRGCEPLCHRDRSRLAGGRASRRRGTRLQLSDRRRASGR